VLGAASREKADSYLDQQMIMTRAQTEVLHLQAHELKQELKLRSLRSRAGEIRGGKQIRAPLGTAASQLGRGAGLHRE
jgi:hypothetical protein